MNNIDLFLYSGEHPEPIIDPYYNREKVVIPLSAFQTNELVEKNARLIQLITVFSYFIGEGKTLSNPDMHGLIDEVIKILKETEGINLSPFSQFFMVYNSTYGSFLTYGYKEQRQFIYEMLHLYVKERHSMYLSHGYSNSTLQVVCDNYSHKRNSKTTIIKICDLLNGVGFIHDSDGVGLLSKNYYFLPDKGDKKAFDLFKQQHGVVMESAKHEQNKLPDMVLVDNDECYVIEMKSMKGVGGGQDKQLTEVINFIRYSEADQHVHYVVFLDGEYSNILHAAIKQPKVECQYKDIISCLQMNPGNYFLNSSGFSKFIHERLNV